jgi:hypothetical protein
LAVAFASFTALVAITTFTTTAASIAFNGIVIASITVKAI